MHVCALKRKMSREAEFEGTSQEPADQAHGTEESISLSDQADASQRPRRSLPSILPETTQRLQIPQLSQQGDSQQQEQNRQAAQPDQQQRQHQSSVDERAVFVIPNCPPTCVPDNPGSCPQILVLPFLPSATTSNSQGWTCD